MAALERIQISLSPFEKLHILREELEERKKELTDVEVEIRDKLQILEMQRYLESLSPYYTANPQKGLPTPEEIEALESRRSQLYDLVNNIEETIPVMLKNSRTAGGELAPGTETAQAAPSKAVGPARKQKFESFDDFKASQEG